MPLPQGTARLKIHPAIGFARLSTNPDFYEFDPTLQQDYKSNNKIKRQAVRFTIFAYDANNQALAELTPQWLIQHGLRAVWHARVGNRKIARVRNDDAYVVSAVARSDANG